MEQSVLVDMGQDCISDHSLHGFAEDAGDADGAEVGGVTSTARFVDRNNMCFLP